MELTRKMLLQSKMLVSHKQYRQQYISPYAQNKAKHFSPTAALILPRKQFTNAKERAVLVGDTIKINHFQ
jgi:hypothetical protein